jgi:D-erythrose 4-phosphate dehydrogenase
LPSTATAASVAAFLRALLESPVAHHLQVVAINEPANLDSMAYLTRFDSTHGRFPWPPLISAMRQLLVDGRAD